MNNRLREIREDRDLTQQDIAKVLSMDQSNYSKYELGKVNVPIEALHILADYYGVSIDYLLYRTDVRKPYPKSLLK